jgi:hypothetical protein
MVSTVGINKTKDINTLLKSILSLAYRRKMALAIIFLFKVYFCFPILSYDGLVYYQTFKNRIGGVMVNVLASSAVDRGFEPRWGQTKDYKIGMCCFSAKHAPLRRKNKDWLARNQNNVSEWSDMSTRGLLFK